MAGEAGGPAAAKAGLADQLQDSQHRSKDPRRAEQTRLREENPPAEQQTMATSTALASETQMA